MSAEELASLLAARPDLISAPDALAARYRADSVMSQQLLGAESGLENEFVPPEQTGVARPAVTPAMRANAATAAGMHVISDLAQLIHVIGTQDPQFPELRSGGVGITRIKNWAQSASVTIDETVLLLELAAQLELLMPTTQGWAVASKPVTTDLWAPLVHAWLTSTRSFHHVPALAEAGISVAAPRRRVRFLTKLLEADASARAYPQQYLTHRFENQNPELIDRWVEQAEYLGLLVADGLNPAASEVLDAVLNEESATDSASLRRAQETMNFPAPATTFRVLADHTIILAGVPTGELLDLHRLGKVISRGAATVFRLTEAKVASSGWSTTKLKRFFDAYSQDPVPASMADIFDQQPARTLPTGAARSGRRRSSARARSRWAALNPPAFPPIGTRPAINDAVERFMATANSASPQASPIKILRDNTGATATVHWVDGTGTPQEQRGVIEGIDHGTVQLETPAGQSLRISVSHVLSVELHPDDMSVKGRL